VKRIFGCIDVFYTAKLDDKLIQIIEPPKEIDYSLADNFYLHGSNRASDAQ
jgi:hypothetical protein